VRPGRPLLSTALTVGALASLAVAFLGPVELRPIAVVATVLFVILGIAEFLARLRMRGDPGRAVIAAHPGETVLATGLIALEGSAVVDRARVVAVLAQRSGLSFRDRTDAEVLAVPADRILSVELAPLNPRSALRPARVALIDGPPVEFYAGVREEQQLETVLAIRQALGRSG
jgi:hypothetical protein